MREELINDVKAQVGSIHGRFNAPNAIGYLFNQNRGGFKIAIGMFCDKLYEISHEQWDYFVSFVDMRNNTFWFDKGKFYQLGPTMHNDGTLACEIEDIPDLRRS